MERVFHILVVLVVMDKLAVQLLLAVVEAEYQEEQHIQYHAPQVITHVVILIKINVSAENLKVCTNK